MIARRPVLQTPRLPGLLVVLILLAPGDLRAHARTVSYSHWEATSEGWNVRVRLPVLELDRRFGQGRWDSDGARALVLDRFVVRTGGEPCTGVWTDGSVQEDEYVAAWTVDCPRPARSLQIDAFFDTAPSHLHFARIRVGEGVLERVVTAAAPTISLAGPEGRGWAASVASGLARFLSRPAHLLCLAGLVLLAASRSAWARTVAAFALGGGVSVSLMVLASVRFTPRGAESLIGLTVFVLGVELFVRGAPPMQALRWRLALCAALLCCAVLGALEWLSVAPWAILGMALVVISLQGLDRSGPAGPVPWVLAAGFGVIHGAGYSGTVETWVQGPGVGSGLAECLGFPLGVAAGVVLAGVVLALRFSGFLREAERAFRCPSFAAERVVASVLTAAGTYGFVKPALGL